MAARLGVFVDEDHSKLPTLYWLPKLHKRQVLLPILVHILLLSCLCVWLLVPLLSKLCN